MKKDVDMLGGNLLKNVILFTIPVILSGILQTTFNAADLFVIGRFGEEGSVGAIGVTGSAIQFMINVFIGLSIGAGISAARAIGSGDGERLYKTVHTAMLVSVIGGAFLTVLGITVARPILDAMGTPPEIIEKATLYMKIYCGGVTANLVYNFGAAIMRASGDTKRPLYYLIIAGVLNVLLNILFVAVFKLDVAGVAIATVISEALSAVLVVLALCKREDAGKLLIKELKIDGKTLGFMLKTGLPSGLQGALFSISNVILQSAVNSLGALAVSGNAAGGSVETFVWLALNSFYQTSLNFFGQNIGARRFDRLDKILRTCFLCVFVLGAVLGTATYLCRTELCMLYLKSAEEAVFGAQRLAAISLPYMLCGFMDIMNGALQGLGKSVSAMIVSLTGLCGGRLLWVLTAFRNVPELHSVQGIFISYPISWSTVLIMQLVIYFYTRKKEILPKIKEQNL